MLSIEGREAQEDSRVDLLKHINYVSWNLFLHLLAEVHAERIVLRALEGGCQVPMGVHARDIVDESGDVRMVMDGFVSSLDGVRFVRAHGECVPSDYETMAQGMVDDLLAGGAGPILSELR